MIKRIIILFAIHIFVTICHAQQIDTIKCDYKYVELYNIKTPQGKIKYYVVYRHPEIQEIIQTSQTVVEYIKLCEQKGIQPSLGLRLKNGRITSVIRLPKKYKIKE